MDYQNRRLGLDFGYVHAQALMQSGFIEKELYIYREYWEKEMDNKDFIKMVGKSLYKDKMIISDSSRPDLIHEWNSEDWMVSGCQKPKGILLMGIDYLKALPCINIHKTNCPNAAREFPLFKRREFRDGRISDTEFVEEDDDTIAAIRYGNEDMILTGGDASPVFTKGIYAK
jgi:phage terminase large subunit